MIQKEIRSILQFPEFFFLDHTQLRKHFEDDRKKGKTLRDVKSFYQIFFSGEKKMYRDILVSTQIQNCRIRCEDQAWIGSIDFNPPGAIIQAVELSGEGWVPTEIWGEILEWIGRPLTDFLATFHNRVTMYPDRQTGFDEFWAICYRGWDNRYYEPLNGEPTQGPNPEDRGFLFPLQPELSLYAIGLREGFIVGCFDRYGRPQRVSSHGTGGVVSYEQIGWPRSLEDDNNNIPLVPREQNQIADFYLNILVENNAVLGQYGVDENYTHFYFVWDNPTPYRVLDPMQFRNMDTDQVIADLPPGRIVDIPILNDAPYDIVMVVLSNDWAYLYYSAPGERVTNVGQYRVGQRGSQTTGPVDRVIYPLRGSNSSPLYRKLIELGSDSTITDYQQVGNELVPVGSVHPVQTVTVQTPKEKLATLALERFFALSYDIPMPELNILGEYTRASWEETRDLLQSDQIVRFETPPLMQIFAGLPGTPNRILTFVVTDGRKSFVKARYDSVANRIDPPL